MPRICSIHAWCCLLHFVHARAVKYLLTTFPDAHHVKMALRSASMSSTGSVADAEKLLAFMRGDPKYNYMPLAMDVQLGDGLHCVTVEHPVVMSPKAATERIEPVCHCDCSFHCPLIFLF